MGECSEQKIKMMKAESVFRALDNTNICYFMYYPEQKKIIVPEKTCAVYNCETEYENMPYSFAEAFVHPDDHDVFSKMYFSIDNGKESSKSIFHSRDSEYWCEVTLTVVSRNEKGNPEEVLGIIENISEEEKGKRLIKKLRTRLAENAEDDDTVQEAINLIANVISDAYITIYHIWLEDFTYICFQEIGVEYSKNIGKRVPCDPEHIVSYVTDWVEQEFAGKMRAFFSWKTLRERLRETDCIQCVYRRKKYGWTKGQYIAAKRDADGNATNVIFTVTDINSDVEREENEKKVLFETQHDQLTQVYNRKGFDDITASCRYNGMRMGLAAVDIDDFKYINDTYGHETGDMILKSMAECLQEAFRSEDRIFRLGGDEFVILLNDCTEEVWNSLCRKLEYIHGTLKEKYKHIKGITISVGLCFSENGYNDEMLALADEALYETKHYGRSGCTLIDSNHNILKRWRDDNFNIQPQTALDRSSTGVYRMEFPDDPAEAPRMFCNETSKMILGVDPSITPEQCYAFWIRGVDTSYLEALKETRRVMLEEGQAECTYLWRHPSCGIIHMRSGGFGSRESRMDVLHGYHHALKNTKIIEKRDDSALLMTVLNDVYFCSYYISLIDKSYSMFEFRPNGEWLRRQDNMISEAFEVFIGTQVAPVDRLKMETFTDLATIGRRLEGEESINCEYRRKTSKGWCQARFVPIRFDKEGKVTHVLFAASAVDAEKAKELDANIHNRKSLEALFNTVPGGIVMYEWNGKQLKTLHISEYYEKQYGYTLVSSSGENKGGPDYKRVHPADLEGFKHAINVGLRETHRINHEYRVWNIEAGRYVWVRIDAVSDTQPDGNDLVYAIYTDITEQKDAELSALKKQASLEAALEASNQLCCEYDPETHIIKCLTEDNFIGLPQVLCGYPESLRNYNFIHPQDFDVLVNATCSADGRNTAHCDIRCLKNGEYRWYSCTYIPYYDSEKERNIAIFTMYDINLRVHSMRDYEERLRILLMSNSEAQSMISINLTTDTFSVVRIREGAEFLVEGASGFDEVVDNISASIVGRKDQIEYRELFHRENLLRLSAEGKTHVQMKFLQRFSQSRYEWIIAAVDMICNPVTGEITGAASSNSVQIAHMSEQLLEKAIQQDYLFAAVVFRDTDEYYLYGAEQGSFSERMQNYWGSLIAGHRVLCSEETLNYLIKEIQKDRILEHIDRENEFVIAYDGIYRGKASRLELRYSYLDDRHSMIFSSIRNITDSFILEKLRHESEHDPLTGLYNRKKVFEKSRELLEEHPDVQFVIAHIDVKHFHMYNTFFGDAAGDKLLCDFADLLREMDKDYEYWAYGRIESDIFCIFMPFDRERYEKHLYRTLEILDNYRGDFLIEPAVGLYYVTDPSMSVEAMFTRATIASRYVRNGRNNVTVIYNDVMEAKFNEERQIVNEMETAIEQEQFKVFLQPKYSLRTNRPVGAEALVRWFHPEHGMILPAKFIPLIEGNGYIAELDRYMWEHVCMLIRKWMDEGKPIVPISVNVSRISMFSPATPHFLKELIKKYRIDPCYLELELTESAYIDNPNEMKNQMAILRDAGFRILMDDFGSGYSSLNTLKELPVDVLKLDMKFQPAADTDNRGSLVLYSIIRMSKLLNLTVIAEGVETTEQADFLRSIGCEYVQGYKYAKPMSVEEYERIVIPEAMNCSDTEITDISRIRHILTDIATNANLLGDLMSIPFALVDYTKSGFSVLRANSMFLSEFELTENLQPASKVFRSHLEDADYDRLQRAFKECMQTKQCVCFELSWNSSDGTRRVYYTRIVYEGTDGIAAVMALFFQSTSTIKLIR